MTRKLTGTVKIHEDPSIYVYDTPGVMVPFLGHGEDGAERGLKLALTGSFHFFRVFHAFAPVTRWADEGSAGIKENLFPHDSIVDYLLWRMNLRLASQFHLPIHDLARRKSNSAPP